MKFTDAFWVPCTRLRIPSLLALILASLVTAGCESNRGSPTVDVADGAAVSIETPPVRPRTVGLDSGLVETAFDRAAELPRLRCLLVARHSQIEEEQCFRGPGLDEYANIKSVSKSVLSAVVGIAIGEGHLEGASQPIGPFFTEYLDSDSTDPKRFITVGHLLSMQSGLDRTSGNNYGAWVQSSNWVRYALTRPLIAQPGTTRLYSTGNTHLLSAILTRATGQSTWQYAREKLAEPMGIRLPSWPADPQGIYFGGNEMRMTPRDMIRFGELYRNLGRVDGRQVVPRVWIEESLAPRTPSRSARETYGYGWFMGRVRDYPYFYAQGYGGQFIFVVPDLELTVATTSHPDDPRTAGHNRALQRIFREMIVPAAERGASARREGSPAATTAIQSPA